MASNEPRSLLEVTIVGLPEKTKRERIATSIDAIQAHVSEALYCARARRDCLLAMKHAENNGHYDEAQEQLRRAAMAETAQASHALQAAQYAKTLVEMACGDVNPSEESVFGSLNSVEMKMLAGMVGSVKK